MSVGLAAERTGLIVLGVLGALLWFLPLNAPQLFNPDEGRYAEVPREMVASTDWVTPRLDAIKYFEKPPLQYWATALAFTIFGLHEWCVRLWPALTGLLGVVLSGLLARRLYDARTAVLAALVQAGALLYVVLARLAVLDMGLCFSLQLAMSALVLMVHAPKPSLSWHAPVLLALGVALAVLSKGLVGILIPGAVGAIYLLLYRDWRLLWRAQLWWSVLGLGLIAAPWFVMVSRRNPEFAQFFFYHEHFQRFLTAEAHRPGPLWYFVPVLFAGFLPWTFMLPQALRRAWQGASSGERSTGMLLIWVAFIFLFFSLSQSKLIPYIVPLLPALALLTARELAQWPARRLVPHIAGVAVAALVLALIALLLPQLTIAAPLVASATASALWGLAAALLVLALCAALALLLCQRGRALSATALLCVGVLSFAQIGFASAGYLPQMRDVAQLRAALRPVLSPATALYCVGDYIQPVPFYLQRPCILVQYRGELDFGLTQEPWRWGGILEQFPAQWRTQRDAVAIISAQAFARLQALGLPMRVIYTSQSFVAVVRQ